MTGSAPTPPVIDAHQHFWRVARGDYTWMTPDLTSMHRDFTPRDLAPILASHGIEATVLVQAAPTRLETDYMLARAAESGHVAGVVGWVDLEHEEAPDQIAALAQNPWLKGLRPMIHDIEPEDWMLKDTLAPAFAAIQRHGLTFDALVKPPHLPHLRTLVARHPDLPVIIDHGAKPEIESGHWQPWADHMAALAEAPQVVCKFSGLITEAGADWSVDRLRPYTDHLIQHFGPRRLLWGSDWPVCTLAGRYDQWREASLSLLGELSAAERASVLGGTAQRVYGLAVPPRS